MEAEENGLDIRLSSKVGAVIVPVDARRITQVFINLLTNSIRYTPTGGSISVVIDKETTNRNEIYASVSIMDNGMGIPEEEIPQLFDRFYRVEKPARGIQAERGLDYPLPINLSGRMMVSSALRVSLIKVRHLPFIYLFSGNGRGAPLISIDLLQRLIICGLS